MEYVTTVVDSPMLAGLVGNSQVMADLLNLSKRRVYQLVDEGVFDKQDAKFSFVRMLKRRLKPSKFG